MITNRIKRGASGSLPNGAAGEPLFTTDTYELYIGKGDGTNQRFQKYIASGTTSQYLRGDGSLETHNLDSLTDVIVSTPSNGQVLQYNGTNWVNATSGFITGSATAAGQVGVYSSVSNIAGYTTFTFDTVTDKLSMTNAYVNNNLTVDGQLVIKSESGASAYTRGLKFPDNSYGGTGDIAGLRLHNAGGENIILELYAGNDSLDTINFAVAAGGSVYNDNVTINGNKIWNAGNLPSPLSSTGTINSGEIPIFSNSTTVYSDTALFWDNSLNRLGVGGNSPNAQVGVTTSSGVNAFGYRTSGANYYELVLAYDNTTYGHTFQANRGSTTSARNITFLNGSNTVSIDESGNMGIGLIVPNPGTSGPGGLGLDVYASTTAALALHNATSGTGISAGGRIYYNSTNMTIRNLSTGNMTMTVDNGNFTVITLGAENIKVEGSTGKVGIGAPASIAEMLTVNGSIQQSGVTNSMIKADSNGKIVAATSSDFVPPSRTLTINGTSYDLSANRTWTISAGIGGSGSVNQIAKFVTNSTTIGDSLITSDTDVKINAFTSIGHNNAANTVVDIRNAGNAIITAKNTTGGTFTYSSIRLTTANSGGIGDGVGEIRGISTNVNNRDTAITFLTTEGSGSQSEKVRISASGKFGILSTNPDSNLEVITGTGAVFRAVYANTNVVEIGNYKPTTSGGAGYQQLDIASSVIRLLTGTAGGGSATERLSISATGLSIFSGNVQIGNNQNLSLKFRTASAWDYSIRGVNDDLFISDNPGLNYISLFYNGGGNSRYISLMGVLSITAGGPSTFSSGITFTATSGYNIDSASDIILANAKPLRSYTTFGSGWRLISLESDNNVYIAGNGGNIIMNGGGNLLIRTTTNPYNVAALVVNHDATYGRTYFQRGVNLIEIIPSNGSNTNQISSSYTSSGSAYKPLSLSARQSETDLYLSTNGNIGIGTSSPNFTLHINGILRNGGASTYWYSGADGGGMYLETVGTTTATRVLRIQGVNDAGNKYSAIKLQAGAEVISFETADTERLRITSGGNILMRTTSSPTFGGFTNTTLSIKQIADGSSGGGIHIESLTNENVAFFGFDGSAFKIGTSYRSTGSYQPIIFSTNGIDCFRMTTGRYSKFTSDATYIGSTGNYHEFTATSAANDTLSLRHKAASQPFGQSITFSGATPNNVDQYFLYCQDTTNAKAIIWSNGTFVSRTGTYTNFSDENIKQDIIDAQSQWDDIKNIKVRKYRLKDEVAADPNYPFHLGVIAQEIEPISPGLVDQTPNYKTLNGERIIDGHTKIVKYSVLYMKAVKALQEAMDRIEKLEAKLN